MIQSFRTDSLGKQCRPYTVCHSVCIVWTHYSMVEPHSSNFRMITANFLGVRIFWKFTVKAILCGLIWKCATAISFGQQFAKIRAGFHSLNKEHWLPRVCYVYVHYANPRYILISDQFWSLYPRHLCRGVYSFRLSVRMYIRNLVLFLELLQSFTLKQSEWVYLTNHSSKSIHIWTIGTLGVGFHSMTPHPRVHAPEWG